MVQAGIDPPFTESAESTEWETDIFNEPGWLDKGLLYFNDKIW